MSFEEEFEDVDIVCHGVRLPEISISDKQRERYSIPKNITNEKLLKFLCKVGLEKKGVLSDPKYIARARKELELVLELGFCDYFLLVWDVLDFCRENDIAYGPGRGSCVSSLVMYSMGITQIDPVENDLLFERFISRARAKSKTVDGILYIDGSLAPDADLDICTYRRIEVINYLKNKYSGKFCKLPTITTLASRACLKDVGKIAAGISEDELTVATKQIPVKFGKPSSVLEAIEESDKFKEFANQYPDVIDKCNVLEGLMRQKGSHASAFLISYQPLDDFLPVELDESGEVISLFDMNFAQEESIKMDLLGLDAVSNCDKLIKTLSFDISNFDPNDKEIYELSQCLDLPYGLFQLAGTLNWKTFKKIEPRSWGELADVISLSRPGSYLFVDDYIENAENDYWGNKQMKEILSETHGIPIFQEQIILLASKVFGFSLEEGEMLRRTLAKKKSKEVDEWIEKIDKKREELGLPAALVEYFKEIVRLNASYGFNKCLHPDTVVNSKNGPRRMKDCSVGDKIEFFNPKTNRAEFTLIKGIYENKKELFIVSLGSGRFIRCSMDHKILCADLEMRKLKDIPLGTKIIERGGVSQLISVNSIGIFDTLDFEVEDENHNFYANDIVVSNSHAYAYAYLAALTLYFKFKHPKEFYTECLRMAVNKTDSQEHVNAISAELRFFGIKLLQPDFLKSKMDFTIEGDNIRFGFSSIKGVAAKSLDALQSFLTTEKSNKFEVFNAASESKLNIGIVCALIQAGLLNSVSSDRERLVYEAQVWNLLTEKEQVYCLERGPEYDFDLFFMLKNIENWLNEKGKPLTRKGRIDTIRKNAAKYNDIYKHNKEHPSFAAWWYERKLLGYSYSSSLKNIFLGKRKSLVNIQEIKDSEDNSSIETVVEVVEARKGTSKNGNKYIKMILSDETGTLTAMMLGDKYEAFSRKESDPKEGDILFIVGSKSPDIVWINKMKSQSSKIYLKLADFKRGEREKVDKTINEKENESN